VPARHRTTEGTTTVQVGAVTEPGQTTAMVSVPAQDPAPPPGKGPEFGNASPVGLVVVLLLLIATVVLIRSMSRRIRRLPASFDRSGSDDGAGPDGGAGDPSGEAADGSATGSDNSGRG